MITSIIQFINPIVEIYRFENTGNYDVYKGGFRRTVSKEEALRIANSYLKEDANMINPYAQSHRINRS